MRDERLRTAERQAAAAKIEALQRGKAAREVVVPMLEQRKDAGIGDGLHQRGELGRVGGEVARVVQVPHACGVRRGRLPILRVADDVLRQAALRDDLQLVHALRVEQIPAQRRS